MRQLLLLFATLILALTAQSQETRIEIPNLGLMPIPQGSKTTTDSLGNIVEVILSKPVTVKGITFSNEKPVKFYPTGTLKSFYPLYNTPWTINGQFIVAKALSEIQFYPNGKIKRITLAKDSQILLPNGQKATFKAGTSVKFYDNGQLEGGILAKPLDFTLQNKNIVLRAERPVNFYPSGELKSGFLQIQATFTTPEGKHVKKEKYEFINLDQQGRLIN